MNVRWVNNGKHFQQAKWHLGTWLQVHFEKSGEDGIYFWLLWWWNVERDKLRERSFGGKVFRYIRNICPHDKIYIRQNKSNSYQSDGICIGQICRQGLRINLHLCQDKSVIFCGQIVLMMRMAMQMLGYGNVSCVARRLQHYCGYITPTTPCIILQWIFLDGVESYCWCYIICICTKLIQNI